MTTRVDSQTKIADKKNKFLNIVNKMLIAIIVGLIALIIFFVFIITPMTIDGESMMPTLQNHQKIYVLKVGYDLNYGDIIIFDRPNSNEPPIKRIIGMEGDTIRFDNNKKVWLRNDEQLNEPYINDIFYMSDYFSDTELWLKEQLMGQGLTVKSGELFVLGDNRNISMDSHNYGVIDKSWIKGKFLGDVNLKGTK